ncbi:MAG: protein kinase [Okeania sp. SIO2F4]|uniref:protein kinase domain-containing protein n=1 Tax=Okeania sp. SIO2F4 TaxID=2607790 RepID=UPI001429931C|nr:protein kinase [Okeania sp. SIO2F4]NES02051.1 protein kinase [Okeania sp. SIO2F4]
MSVQVKLTIIQGSLIGKEFIFEERTICIIGRHKDCNPRLPSDQKHRTISRYHCILDINPPDVRVRDFGSRNGTYVNGKKIGQRQPHHTPEAAAKIQFPEYDLKSGDQIKLGKTIFQVSIEAETEMPPEMVSLPKTSLAETVELSVSPPRLGSNNLITIPGYRTIKLLGKGGCGEVYLARNNSTQKLIALKTMLPEVATHPQAINRFVREIENTKALNHKNVVQLKDYSYSDRQFFFTLEYCNGGSILNLLERCGYRLSINMAVPIILQALDGLDYAHNAEIPYVKKADGSFGKGKGLVHRDIKPANIFLSNINSSTVVKIADYGLAKAFDLAGLSGQTITGNKGGTFPFMPRQQMIDFKYVKPEVDVWAIAATLYNMLTGVYPRDFVGKDPILTVLQTKPVPIRKRNIAIPQSLAEVIDLALIDEPEIYFKTAKDFKHALLTSIF